MKSVKSIKEVSEVKEVIETGLEKICSELVSLQRQRTVIIKSRNMQSNRLQAIVAGALGYNSHQEKNDREKYMKLASDKIKAISRGECRDFPLYNIVRTTMIGITAFNDHKDELEDSMIKTAKTLPIASWVEEEEQRGFGYLSLATIIGETGNLFNYETPSRMWKRFGMCPKEFNGQTLMGSTWRMGKFGKLPASEWEEFGYSPRRRSIAYLVGESMVKCNGTGPYRKCYDEQKEYAVKHRLEWIKCKCLGTGKVSGKNCTECLGKGMKMLRCHRHAMMMATKMIMLSLWCRWWGKEMVIKKASD